MTVLPRQVPPSLPPPYQTTPLLNQRVNLLGLAITFMVCSWICTLLRLYIRFVVQRAPGWDDFFIILTMVGWVLPEKILSLG